MKDYSAMSDFEINKQVAESLGNRHVTLPGEYISGSVVSYMVERSSNLNREGQIEIKSYEVRKDFCNNPADAWPIITANNIGLIPYKHNPCAFDSRKGLIHGCVNHENILRAAMIVYLQMMEQKS